MNKTISTASSEVYLQNYKGDLQKFFAEVYGITNLSDVSLKETEKFVHYMIKPSNLDADSIYGGFSKLGYGGLVRKYMDYTDSRKNTVFGSVVQKKTSEQTRPISTYVFAHKGGIEPDEQYLGKTYKDFIENGTFMTIDEYMLVHQFMYWRFKVRLGINFGFTLTTSLDNGEVMTGGFGSGFQLHWSDQYDRNPRSGPRSIVIF
ncbi:MAG: hypothetical protein KBB91_02225 [Candidatus Pacebacteria bacterium]|jgi:hypothetical protein|nr:hypothetical protein [Candidatus Paceibacterota bacterium]MBP9701298.1 hypothetical protein [Candidatus Paceibacterota bacterium]